MVDVRRSFANGLGGSMVWLMPAGEPVAGCTIGLPGSAGSAGSSIPSTTAAPSVRDDQQPSDPVRVDVHDAVEPARQVEPANATVVDQVSGPARSAAPPRDR